MIESGIMPAGRKAALIREADELTAILVIRLKRAKGF